MTREKWMQLLLACTLLALPLHVLGSPGEEVVHKVVNEGAANLGDEAGEGWSWNRILTGGGTIVSNGNVWPPTENESADDCLILVTRNQIMWHCPEGDDETYKSTILFRTVGRIRGAFTAPGTERRRLWLLDSYDSNLDVLLELDTVTGEILQKLIIEGSADGHDAVRVDDHIFVVDTRNGDVVELELPASALPYTESSIATGAKEVKKPGYATIVKRHTGFTRVDHINNVAVHPELLISSLHGGGAITIAGQSDSKPSHTRLSALSRSIPEEEGRELNEEQDRFTPISNVGTWCHNMAFWEDKEANQIKLISLDSKAGSLVSVVVLGPNEGEREEIWTPDLNHPVLTPPEGVAKAYNNGAKVFSKGLAVQGGVAYFSVSYAREPTLRQTVPETLLIAVDLATRKELWVRVIRSNGLIGQILTESYLGWQVQLPEEISTIEVTLHGSGGTWVEHCDDLVAEKSRFCKPYQKDGKRCGARSSAASDAREICCACGGGERYELPLLAGKLDEEIMDLDEEVTMTATFRENYQCTDKNGTTKHLPIGMKAIDKVPTITNFDEHLGYVLKHICNVNVKPIQERLMKLGDKGMTNESQQMNGNAIITERKYVMEEIKPGTTSIQLVFSSRDVSHVYHFPWLEDWLPIIQEHILEPIGLPFNRVIRMMFANMPEGSTINFHNDLNPWVQKAHRVHIPIITNPDVFFLTEIGSDDEEEILRIKSKPGDVYEFNNACLHAVRNYGPSRIHLILDWVEEPYLDTGSQLVKPNPGDACAQLTNENGILCKPLEPTKTRDPTEIVEATAKIVHPEGLVM